MERVDGEAVPEYRATMSRHIKSVNCVRFNHSGDILASAGDGGSILLWRRQNAPPTRILGDISDEEDGKEYWSVITTIRASDVEDIYDLCWSPDDRFILLGLTDNTAQIWDVGTFKLVRVLRDHHHFVQGVAWDPMGRYIVTQSADRTVKIWQIRLRSNGALQVTPLNKLGRIPDGVGGQMHLFHDETLLSFFRRPSWSPDGALLFLPAGVGEDNCFYIMTRGGINGLPIARIGGFERPVLGVSCNPRLFNNTFCEDHLPLFKLSYRIVYAVFTMDAVAVFDTQQKEPIVMIRDLHYGSLTDVSWSPDGYSMILTATDGFCSMVAFEVGELGSTLSMMDQTEAISTVQTRVGTLRKSIPQVQNVLEQETLISSRIPSSDPMDVDAINTEIPPSVQTISLTSSNIAAPPKRRIQPTLISPQL
jgi:chromatin assembly factor 1 subunit B